jgi:predicted site-specific integrase-resolvase
MSSTTDDRLRRMRVAWALTDEWLKVSEVADKMNMSEKTVRKFIDLGYLACSRYPNGRIRIAASEVARVLLEQERRR